VIFGALLTPSIRSVPAILLTGLVLLVAFSIPIASPDSTYYIDTARQLAEGHGPVTYALHLGMPAVPSPAGFWPTLYPSFLGLVMAVGVEADRAPAVINAASLVALCLVLVRIGRRCVPAGWAWPVALLSIAHPFYADVLVSAWSEALFMVFVYAGLAVVLDIERESAAPLKKCAVAGVLAGAAFATRYAGIFLLGYLVAVVCVIAYRNRWKPAGAAGAVAVLVVAFALLALPAVYPNLRAYGSAFGMPRSPESSMARAAIDRGREIALAGGKLWLHAVVLVMVAAAVQLVTRTVDPADDDERATHGASGWLFGGWIAFYVCALFVSLVPYVRGDPLNGRFLAPIVPATVSWVTLWLARGRMPVRTMTTAVASLLALGMFVYARYPYRSHGVAARDPLATWAREHANESSVFVGTLLWDLRHQTGAIVLTDGYPEMPRLQPARVGAFLGRQGARFRTAHLVFSGAGEMKSVSAPAYERALAAVGFLFRRSDQLEDGSVVVTLER
jgi:hypothetical protein